MFEPEVLDLIHKFSYGVSLVTSMALIVSYPTLAAALHMFINAYNNTLSVVVAWEYSFPRAKKAKEFLKVGIFFSLCFVKFTTLIQMQFQILIQIHSIPRSHTPMNTLYLSSQAILGFWFWVVAPQIPKSHTPPSSQTPKLRPKITSS